MKKETVDNAMKWVALGFIMILLAIPIVITYTGLLVEDFINWLGGRNADKNDH